MFNINDMIIHLGIFGVCLGLFSITVGVRGLIKIHHIEKEMKKRG